MIRFAHALLLLALLPGAARACDVADVVAQPAPRAAKGQLAPAERERLLALHNRCRETAAPTPKPALPALEWNDEAAKVAQRWADRCVFEHNRKRGDYGENIAFYTRPAIDGLALLWLAEARDYSWQRDRCTTGRVCGHYTQVVSRRTTSVGCAAAKCPFGRYLVCDYAPPGNLIGKRPY
ncbi:MAG TPA: CAP domain-containing protein [Xanthomonadales bacterium]|nr:CAP domain-containing protein [Xanthomonadales bacterium]